MKSKNKNSFFLFCFSLLPGAGEMYLGFMRQGISIMSLFWFIVALSSWLNIGPFLFLLPVIWFYSFFHSHNLHRMPEEKFEAVEDTFLFGLSDLENLSDIFNRNHNIVAIVLIVLGVGILWNVLLDALYLVFPEWLYSIIRRLGNLLPRLAAGAFVILLGLHFIRGKKAALALEGKETIENASQNADDKKEV